MKTANQIRAKRAEVRCSQLSLARLSGLTRYRVSLFECGYCNPTPSEAAALKRTFRLLKGGDR